MEMIPAFYFDGRALQALADQHRQTFQQARPCQQVVIDDFLPPEILDRLIAEFPDWTDSRWEVSGAGRTHFSPNRESAKLFMRSEAPFPPFIRHFLAELNSAVFVQFLESLSGMKGLIVDPTFNGCGMHSTGRGGRLMLHTDANRHPIAGGRLHQVLNLIIYLNRDWRDEYGGHLEFWEKSPRRCVTRIAPLANRLVLFVTGTRALHGHPEPVGGPENQRRNSLAVYYYTLDRPTDQDYDHFQIDVNWHPSSEEDVRFARESVARLHGAVAQMKGSAVPFAASRLPEVVKTALPLGDKTTIFLFEWDEVGEPDRFIDGHLRALLAERPDSLEGARPFGLIGDLGAITALVDDEGRIFLCNGPDATQLWWVGFAGQFMKMIG